MIPKSKPARSIYLPALKSKMGNWSYFITSMRFGDLVERVGLVKDMHHPERYDEWLQRDLRPERVTKIREYITNRKERFFSSLVVSVYAGAPKWLDLALLDTESFSLDDISGLELDTINEALGLLFLSGDEDLFALDGQHRLAGIRQAVEANPDRADDIISVIFVADRGMIEKRRLFTSLNRYAAPVTPGEKVILDEDDALAIITRRLMSEHPLLSNKHCVAPPQRASLSWDDPHLTTALTLYKISGILCLGLKNRKKEGWDKKNLTDSERPEAVVLDDVYSLVALFWSELSNHFAVIGEITKNPSTAVHKYRSSDGGSLFLRPVGQMAFARAVRYIIDKSPTEDFTETVPKAISQLKQIDRHKIYDVNHELWNNLLWNSANNSMLGTVPQQRIAARLLCYYSGLGDPLYMHRGNSDLLDSYRKIVGDEKAKLPNALELT